MPSIGLLLLVDLDGVLYRGASPVPGVAEVLAARARAGDDIVYVTNNSMWYRAEYVDRIAGMGAPVTADRIVSSPRATALYLVDHAPSVSHVLTVGASGLDRELEDAGFRVTRAGDAAEHIRGGGVEGTDGGNGWDAAGRPDAVVVGLDPKFDYLRLTVATDCVRAGARFVATNRDPVYPTERASWPESSRRWAGLPDRHEPRRRRRHVRIRQDDGGGGAREATWRPAHRARSALLGHELDRRR